MGHAPTHTVLFDMDRTLVGMDTLKGLWVALARAGVIPKTRLLGLLGEQMLYLAGLRALDDTMSNVYGLLVGRERQAVEAVVERYVAEVVAPTIFAEAVERIEAHRARGDRVVLASASPAFVCRRVATLVGIHEVIATHYEEDGHRFGPLRRPGAWGDGKVESARRAGLIEVPPLVYTDHVGDLPLVLAAQHATLVNPMPALVQAAVQHGVPHEVVRWERPWRGAQGT